MTTPGRKKRRSGKEPRGKERGGKQRTRQVVTIPRAEKVDFPEVKGKTLEALQLSLDTDESGISLIFQDKTHLEFSIEPLFTVRTEYSDWKTHNWRKIRRWPPFSSTSAWMKW